MPIKESLSNYKDSSKSIKLLKQKIELEKKLKSINSNLIEDRKSNLKIRCIGWLGSLRNGCGKLLYAKNLELIKIMSYERPYSCTGGDYHYLSEYQFECPKCKQINRFPLTKPNPNHWSSKSDGTRYEISEFIEYFGSTKEKYLS